jgi:hypothetical protein
MVPSEHACTAPGLASNCTWYDDLAIFQGTFHNWSCVCGMLPTYSRACSTLAIKSTTDKPSFLGLSRLDVLKRDPVLQRPQSSGQPTHLRGLQACLLRDCDRLPELRLSVVSVTSSSICSCAQLPRALFTDTTAGKALKSSTNGP